MYINQYQAPYHLQETKIFSPFFFFKFSIHYLCGFEFFVCSVATILIENRGKFYKEK